MRLDLNRIILALAETAFVFGLVLFLYVAVIGIVHPEWLPGAISHHQWTAFIRLDNVGMVAFVVSLLGFLVSRYLRDRPS